MRRAKATLREWARTAIKAVFPDAPPEPTKYGVVENLDGEVVVFEGVTGSGFVEELGGSFFYVDYIGGRALLAGHLLKRYSETTQAAESVEEASVAVQGD